MKFKKSILFFSVFLTVAIILSAAGIEQQRTRPKDLKLPTDVSVKAITATICICERELGTKMDLMAPKFSKVCIYNTTRQARVRVTFSYRDCKNNLVTLTKEHAVHVGNTWFTFIDKYTLIKKSSGITVKVQILSGNIRDTDTSNNQKVLTECAVFSG